MNPPLEIPTRLLPNYAGPEVPLAPSNHGDAGRDLYAACDVVLPPGTRAVVPTGIAVALPETDLELQIRPRSGHAAKVGLTVLNSPGTVDSGFRGEVGVILHNTNPTVPTDVLDLLCDVLDGSSPPSRLQTAIEFWREAATIRFARGDRIAQGVVARFIPVEGKVVDALPDSTRGNAGFGSTG